MEFKNYLDKFIGIVEKIESKDKKLAIKSKKQNDMKRKIIFLRKKNKDILRKLEIETNRKYQAIEENNKLRSIIALIRNYNSQPSKPEIYLIDEEPPSSSNNSSGIEYELYQP